MRRFNESGGRQSADWEGEAAPSRSDIPQTPDVNQRAVRQTLGQLQTTAQWADVCLHIENEATTSLVPSSVESMMASKVHVGSITDVQPSKILSWRESDRMSRLQLKNKNKRKKKNSQKTQT